jgi:hypothetical protein
MEPEITKVYRFEGMSNPSDMEVIYLIKACDGTIGYFQDVYGAYAAEEPLEGLNNFIRQIPEAGRTDQELFEL